MGVYGGGFSPSGGGGGAVTSVNTKTGAVVLNAADVGALANPLTADLLAAGFNIDMNDGSGSGGGNINMDGGNINAIGSAYLASGAAYNTDGDSYLTADGSGNMNAVCTSFLVNGSPVGGGGSPPFTLSAGDTLVQDSVPNVLINLDALGNPGLLAIQGSVINFDTNGNPEMAGFSGGYVIWDTNNNPRLGAGVNYFGFDSSGNPQVVGRLLLGGAVDNGGAALQVGPGVGAAASFADSTGTISVAIAFNAAGSPAALSSLYTGGSDPTQELAAALCLQGDAAGVFSDGSGNITNICDQTNAITATGKIVGSELHAANGFTGSGVFTTFTITDGVITNAS